jgi:D-arginine dehydrogenase
MKNFDIIVIGAGIAGASVAARLASETTVCVLEMEDRAGYHTTGRSAAAYEPNYGPREMLAFARASKDFLEQPPTGFADQAILTCRNSLFVEAQSQEAHTENLLSSSIGLEEISVSQAQSLMPVLRDAYAQRIFLDTSSADIDVDVLHRGFLKMLKQHHGELVTNAPATAIERKHGTWHVTTPNGVYTAKTIVNCAGAWGDLIAKMAGARPVGLVPKRRSIAIVPTPQGIDSRGWPFISDTGETWYCKPQSGKLMVSSADTTPVEPHDAYADDMAIAEGIDRMMQATTIEVDRVDHSWGGLRTFMEDGIPAVGYDPHTEDFFWLVGQGGYGIMTSPALSAAAAELVLHRPFPAAMRDRGIEHSMIAPERCRPS